MLCGSAARAKESTPDVECGLERISERRSKKPQAGRDREWTPTDAKQAADMASCELATFGSQEIGVNDSLIFGLGLTVRTVAGCRMVHRS